MQNADGSSQYQLGAAEGVSLLCESKELQHSQTRQEIFPPLHWNLGHVHVTAINQSPVVTYTDALTNKNSMDQLQ